MWGPEVEEALRWLLAAIALIIFALGLMLGKFVL